ncbi:FtsX-like permease family protein [Streptacidiphilus sp. PAMC 29251]
MSSTRRTPSDSTAVTSWTRTRLGSAKGAALALTLLTLLTVFLATSFPRQLERYQDQALNRSLASAPQLGRSIEGHSVVGRDIDDRGVANSYLAPAGLVADAGSLSDAVHPPLSVRPQDVSSGLHTTSASDQLTDPGLPAPNGVPPILTLDSQPDPATHARLLSGRLPRGPIIDQEKPFDEASTLEVAITNSTADALRLRLGATLHLSPAHGRPLLIHVVGILRPSDPRAAYWTAEPLLAAPALETLPMTTIHFWHAEALVAPGATATLTAIGDVEAYWWLPLAPGSLQVDQVGPALTQLADLVTGPDSTTLASLDSLPGGMQVSTGLPDLLTGFTSQNDAITPVLTIGVSGCAGAVLAVLLMAGGLAADRRRNELALMRGRGASMPGLARLLFGETLVCTTTGAVLGAGAAFLLLPAPHRTVPALAGFAVWAVASTAVPLRCLAGHSRPQPTARAEGLLTARPSRRRTVAELTTLLVAVAAAVSVRRQGLAPGGGAAAGGVDPLLSGAPALLGLAGALLLVRLYPWPLRVASRPTARRGGAVAFLGLARAGRSSAGVSLLPLLALLLALTVTSFGTEVLGGVTDAHAAQSLRLVGADASVSSEGGPLPAALVTAVGRSPGVRSVLGIGVDQPETYAPNGLLFELDGVDPTRYAALSRSVDAGTFAPSLLRYSGGGAGGSAGSASTGGSAGGGSAGGSAGPIPVLASRALAASMGAGPHTLDTHAFGPLTVRVVGTLPHDLANPLGEFMVVPQTALPPLLSTGKPIAPSSLLLSGPVDAGALRATVKAHAGHTLVALRIRSEVAAQTLVATPLQNGAEQLYAWTVAAAALLTLIAVLLSLLQAVPERASLLARLRTMGMTPRQGYRLILVEALPQILLGVLAGTGLGLVAIPLFGPSVDLSALAGDTDPGRAVGLQPHWLPLLAPGLGLLLLAAGVVAAEAAVIGRRQIAVELRAGGGGQ